MPYRRLPNTNLARLRALQAAVDMGTKIDDINSLAYELSVFEDAKAILPKYHRAVTEYRQCMESQSRNSHIYQQNAKMARLYVSHFIQVVNMCVIRNEIRKDVKTLYGLDPESYNAPDLMSDEDLVKWGRLIIDGERKRQMNGGTPIYNPSISRVQVFYDNYLESERNQKTFQTSTARKMDEVNALNVEVDKIILTIWDQVDAKFASMSPDEKLKKCQEYGMVYYYRRYEKRKIEAEANSGEEEEEID